MYLCGWVGGWVGVCLHTTPHHHHTTTPRHRCPDALILCQATRTLSARTPHHTTPHDTAPKSHHHNHTTTPRHRCPDAPILCQATRTLSAAPAVASMTRPPQRPNSTRVSCSEIKMEKYTNSNRRIHQLNLNLKLHLPRPHHPPPPQVQLERLLLCPDLGLHCGVTRPTPTGNSMPELQPWRL